MGSGPRPSPLDRVSKQYWSGSLKNQKATNVRCQHSMLVLHQPIMARLLSLLPSSTKKIVVKVGPPLTPRMSTYQKSLETVFSIAICRHSSGKLQSNSLLLTILSTFMDRINVLDCRLSDEPPSSSC